MDRLTEQAALLALLRPRRRGCAQIADQVEEAGSALRVLEEQYAGGQGDLFEPPTTDLSEHLDRAAAEISRWDSRDIRLVTLLDEDYPAQLLTVHQRPPFLFYRGTLSTSDASGIAVVGTRKASPTALERAAEIASGLARRGRTVVSGLAAGIDTAAHQAALEQNGRTVAVIGSGLLRAYPPQNADLQERIARQHLVLSQFWPDQAPSKTSFPMRNAIMSGYAAATVVVEAPEHSGARIQARLALEHGRPLFLLDTLLTHTWAREYAKRPGAAVVSDAGEVLDRLDEIRTTPDEVAWP
ncbi:MAG TPA: DNA-processing protein DprA [Mycobacteriales bacterium]|nr:DNA-processing protein DprA [Mycobacteriales bacterium]